MQCNQTFYISSAINETQAKSNALQNRLKLQSVTLLYIKTSKNAIPELMTAQKAWQGNINTHQIGHINHAMLNERCWRMQIYINICLYLLVFPLYSISISKNMSTNICHVTNHSQKLHHNTDWIFSAGLNEERWPVHS